MPGSFSSPWSLLSTGSSGTFPDHPPTQATSAIGSSFIFLPELSSVPEVPAWRQAGSERERAHRPWEHGSLASVNPRVDACALSSHLQSESEGKHTSPQEVGTQKAEGRERMELGRQVSRGRSRNHAQHRAPQKSDALDLNRSDMSFKMCLEPELECRCQTAPQQTHTRIVWPDRRHQLCL